MIWHIYSTDSNSWTSGMTEAVKHFLKFPVPIWPILCWWDVKPYSINQSFWFCWSFLFFFGTRYSTAADSANFEWQHIHHHRIIVVKPYSINQSIVSSSLSVFRFISCSLWLTCGASEYWKCELTVLLCRNDTCHWLKLSCYESSSVSDVPCVLLVWWAQRRWMKYWSRLVAVAVYCLVSLLVYQIQSLLH